MCEGDGLRSVRARCCDVDRTYSTVFPFAKVDRVEPFETRDAVVDDILDLILVTWIRANGLYVQ